MIKQSNTFLEPCFAQNPLEAISIQLLNLESIMSNSDIQQVSEQGHLIFNEGKQYVNRNIRELNVLYNTTVVGASGALFGLLLAFGMLFPNTQLFLIVFCCRKASEV